MSGMITYVRRHWVGIFLSVYAVVLMLFVSHDSFLCDITHHRDAIWFFTCGKAWMNGMVPYVDFADSKGPLMWLVYGVGYLLSPRNLAGVWVITCLLYATIYLLLYRIVRLFVSSRRSAVLAVVAMNLSFFFTYMHNETRCEDFNLLFIVWSLYYVCRILYAHDRSCLSSASAVLGVSAAATLLIKYNATVMLLAFAAVVWVAAYRERRLLRSCLLMAAGAAAVLLPFAVYMLAVGCFDDFLYDYFIITPYTLVNAVAVRGTVWSRLYLGRETCVPFFTLLGLCVLVFGLVHTRLRTVERWFPLVGLLWFFAVALVNGVCVYYFYPCGVFALFGLITVVQEGASGLGPIRWWLCVVAITATVVAMSLTCRPNIMIWKDSPVRQAMQRYTSLMRSAHVEKPRVIYYNNIFYIDFGMPLEALPGCKYWVKQTGATPAMVENQIQAIEHDRADFVFALDNEENRTFFDSLGYTRYTDDQFRLDLYTKHILQPSPAGVSAEE